MRQYIPVMREKRIPRRRRKTDSKPLKLYSITFTIDSYQGSMGPYAEYVALPKTVKMLSMQQLGQAIRMRGYANANVSGVSYLGEFSRDTIPEGCITILRNMGPREERCTEHKPGQEEQQLYMFRPDWEV